MSDTFPDETLYPVLETLADEDRIFASNSAAGHESSQIKGSTIKGLINALKGTPPETLDTLAKLAAAINNDPNFHTTLATAIAPLAPLASPALTGTPTAPTAAVGTNTTQLATTAFVTGALAGAAGIPAGVICMWSGTIATVPTGWALCDGANGTPDLVDRFVVAAGSTAGGDKYDPGDTGGLDSVTLALTQIPSHRHSGTTGGGGAHTHVVGVPFWGGQSGGVSMIDKRDAAKDDPAFSAAASVQPAPDHTHSFWTNYQGGGGSHENRPPYYALAFIMKL